MSAAVLVVDDSQFVREALAAALRAAIGLEVYVAKNGGEALELLRGDPSIRAVVVDVEMPIVDGREMLARLAATGIAPLFIVVVGSQVDAPILDDCRRLGANAVLAKPFAIENLCALLWRGITQEESGA